MEDKCPYLNNGHCMVMEENEILKYELEEAAELSDANWNEIMHLYHRIEGLVQLLVEAGIEIPVDLFF